MQQALLKVFAGFLTFIAFSICAIANAPTTDLEQLTQGADVIFKGVCQEKRKETLIRPETGKELPVVVYVFQTEEVIKGNVGSAIEVKQWGVRSRSEAIQLGLGPVDTSQFEVGKEYLLFLSAPSKRFGFRFVMGSGDEGKFEITKNSEGKPMVTNPSGNRGLFRGVQQKSLSKSEQTVVQAPPGPVPYEDFTDLVRKALQ